MPKAERTVSAHRAIKVLSLFPPTPIPPPTPALIFPRAVGRRLECPQGNQVTVPLTDQQSQEAIWLKDTDMVAEVGGP